MTNSDTPTNGLELYHFDRSSAASKVRIALAEKALGWKSHILNTSVDCREQQSESYLRLNPRGVVPTLIHNGRVIRESQVILEYLEDAFPEPPLRPADPYLRARMRLWTKLADEGLHAHCRTIAVCVYMRDLHAAAGREAMERYYSDMPELKRRQNDLANAKDGLDSPLLIEAVGYFKNVFRKIDATLADDPWLAGDALSLADISMAVYVTRLGGMGMAPLWDHFGHLLNWHERLRARPSYKTGVEDWGDRSATLRLSQSAQAFPVIKEIWDAA